jgi:protein ImuB
MVRILCLHLPNWPVQRLLASDRGLDPSRPIILHARDSHRGQIVAACNAVAAKHGVRSSMPLAEAAALAGKRNECYVLPSNPAADLAALARLAEDCEQFCPLVGWQTTHETPPAPDVLLLDITGTATLFGGETFLAREVVRALARHGYSGRVAIADTIGAAWARSVAGEEQDLPVSALRVPTETIAVLSQLGITQIAQLEKLPRASLRARFGDQLMLRLDQFFGRAQERIVAHRPPPEFSVERALDFPAETRELIEMIVVELVQRIAAALAERRQGAVQLSCWLDSKPPLVLRVGLFRPSANPQHLCDLLRMQLDRSLPREVSRVRLAAPLTAPLENRQRELFGGNRHDADRQFESLIDRLSSRLGAEAVLRPELTADPVPERAVAYVPLLPAKKVQRRTPLAHRPALLRSPPLALAVTSVVPDGPPVSFQFCGQANIVARWWGPERIESGWWRGPSVRRDYYSVEIESGERYWLFRRLADGKWFMHGEFA